MTEDDVDRFTRRGIEEREAARTCVDIHESAVRALLADRYEAVARAYRTLNRGSAHP